MSPVERKILLNPGPATTSEGVKQALLIPDICPREDAFCEMLLDVRRRLAAIAGDTARISAIPVVGSGTTALEATLVSFIPDDGLALILENGDYGTRLLEMARVCGIPHRGVTMGWGQAIDLAVVERTLQSEADAITHLVFVHHETSSGLLNPLDELTALAARFGVTVIVDAMSSFAALPVPIGTNGADILVSSANKCIQGMAGLSFAIATHRAIEDARRATPRSLALNLVAEFDHLEKTGQMRFTCPPQLLSALHRALIEFEAEGLEARGERYAKSMQTLVTGLRELGFELLLEDRHQSGILVAIREPRERWYDFKAMHDALFEEGFTIYPGKPDATPTFRLAVLGDIDETDIQRFLSTFRRYLETAKRS
jgi:2-aminoethylphosphonate-pyruvate transaminase